MDRQQDVIRRITAHVVGYRFQLENERHERERNMAIEIKGLKADALTARANLDKMRWGRTLISRRASKSLLRRSVR